MCASSFEPALAHVLDRRRDVAIRKDFECFVALAAAHKPPARQGGPIPCRLCAWRVVVAKGKQGGMARRGEPRSQRSVGQGRACCRHLPQPHSTEPERRRRCAAHAALRRALQRRQRIAGDRRAQPRLLRGNRAGRSAGAGAPRRQPRAGPLFARRTAARASLAAALRCSRLPRGCTRRPRRVFCARPARGRAQGARAARAPDSVRGPRLLGRGPAARRARVLEGTAAPPPPPPFPLPLALLYARCSETSCAIHSHFISPPLQ
jgi:hypothetical protein